MASITRNSFLESKKVVKKIFQKYTKLLDSDINEQIDIELTRSRRMLSALMNHENKRFVDGFKVEGTGASLQVTIKAGFGAFHIATQKAVLLQLMEDYSLTGFTTWSTSRTDYIYIDIWESEYGAAEDPNLVNPDLGEVTCVDQRIQYTINISEGAVPGTPPANHTYISLASITKTTGSNIDNLDVTTLISYFTDLPDSSITTSKIADSAITDVKLNNNSVTENKISDGAVTLNKLSSNSVSTNKIVDGAVTADKLAADSVVSSKLINGAVTSSKIANETITEGNIANDAITNVKILDDTIAGSKLSSAVGGVGLDKVSNAFDVTGIKELNGTQLKAVCIDIGTWNMLTTANISFAHNLNKTKIRDVRASIREDGYPVTSLEYCNLNTGITAGSIFWNDTHIHLYRIVNELFHSSSYSSTAFSRGWVTIWYVE